MKLPLLISLSLLLAAQRAPAQSADDFFHGGAQAYISNNLAVARQTVDGGLKLYPEDEKLQKLDKLLKQQQQSQNSQSQQNQSQQQDQQDRNQNQNQKQEQQQAKGPPDKKNQSQQPKPSPAQEKKEEDHSTKEGQARQMTPEEAKQLLDSQKNDELTLPVSRKEKNPAEQRRPLRDW